MRPRFVLSSFLFCFALFVLPAIPVLAENLLDVIEAAQNSIETKYPNPESIARKLALEQLEKIARSDKPEDEIIRAILESFPETSSELSGKSDLNSNGIPDDWEKKRNVSARFTAPESDEDSDGFTLLQEYRADTDPLDPLSHPKYITQVYVSAVSRQRFAGLELLSVYKNPPWAQKTNWDATFNVVRNDRRRSEVVRINKGTFTNNNVSFSVVDIEEGDSDDFVVYIRRAGMDERIPCRPRQPVYDPLPRVKFLNALDGKVITGQVGDTLKLGSKNTGEETYRIVSAALDTKMAVVESVGDKSETFKLPPVPGNLPAAKTPAKTSSAKASEKPASPARKTEE